jgi:hypothetical protein
LEDLPGFWESGVKDSKLRRWDMSVLPELELGYSKYSWGAFCFASWLSESPPSPWVSAASSPSWETCRPLSLTIMQLSVLKRASTVELSTGSNLLNLSFKMLPSR